MLDVVLFGFLAVFSTGALLLLGCGNKAGIAGALITGLVGGLLIAVPMLREQDWFASAFMVGFGLVGALIGTRLPQTNRVKRFMLNQTNLRVSCKYFRLGKES